MSGSCSGKRRQAKSETSFISFIVELCNMTALLFAYLSSLITSCVIDVSLWDTPYFLGQHDRFSFIYNLFQIS